MRTNGALGSESSIAYISDMDEPIDSAMIKGRQRAEDAHRLALQYGQNDLAAAIERELAKLK